MVRLIRVEDVGNGANNALVRSIILARAAVPRVRVLDVDLPAGMREAQEPAGQDGHRVLLVGNPREARATGERGDVSVDVVCKGLVADARHAVADNFERGGGGQVQG